ncbi:VOC family protein [Agromyces arachidis]|uniref:VOC family protein n=1 Tax=Agromyces arachidis TaxID=766966 RepID=UPI0040578AAD
MLAVENAFPGFSVDDLDAAREFYGSTLGLDVVDEAVGGLRLTLPSGQPVFVYPKPDHVPAGFTVLNFVVADIDTAVDQLNDSGVTTKIYTDGWAFGTDERGIARGSEENPGPVIAWFRDPAGNVLSVIEM